jgi:hypothetical protein
MTHMSEPKLAQWDWEEVLYALDFKADEIEKGRYDEVPGEVDGPNSKTSKWAAHLRRIMRKIGPC